MPDFTKAQVTTGTSQDLAAYKTFLKRLTVGQTVTLPLEPGETSRRVMRAVNSAASQSSMRLVRLPAAKDTVRFRVVPEEKRRVALTEEAKRARVEKARATRDARRQLGGAVEAMGLGGLAIDPTGHQGDQPVDAALTSADVIAEEALGDVAVRAEELPPAKPPRRQRVAS